MFTAILTSAIFFPIAILFKEKPKTPPSISENKSVKTKLSILWELQILFKDKDFILIAIAISLMISYTYVFPSLLD